MLHDKVVYTKLLFLIIAVGSLSACGTSRVYPISDAYTQVPPEKGLVAFRIGYKTIEPENHFIDIPIYMYFNGANEAKTKSIIKKFAVNSSEFEQTEQPDYKKSDYIIELDAGEYSTHPAMVVGHALIKPQPSRFDVKEGKVTYIGQYDIEAIVKGGDFLSRVIRKKVSYTRDQKSRNVEEILTQYPDVKYSGIIKQPAQERSYRMIDPAASQSSNMHIHVYKTNKK